MKKSAKVFKQSVCSTNRNTTDLKDGGERDSKWRGFRAAAARTSGGAAALWAIDTAMVCGGDKLMESEKFTIGFNGSLFAPRYRRHMKSRVAGKVWILNRLKLNGEKLIATALHWLSRLQKFEYINDGWLVKNQRFISHSSLTTHHCFANELKKISARYLKPL